MSGHVHPNFLQLFGLCEVQLVIYILSYLWLCRSLASNKQVDKCGVSTTKNIFEYFSTAGMGHYDHLTVELGAETS